MKRPDLPLILLWITAFLAPVLGGQLSTDTQALTSPFIVALFGGTEIPLFTHLLIGAGPLIALIYLLTKRKVLQVPPIVQSSLLLVFFSFLVISLCFTSFLGASLAVLAEWLVYGVAYYAVIGSVGRKVGPQGLVIAFFSGCCVLALRGMLEYAGMKSQDPHWRIFAGWTQPNILGGMLLIGFFLGLGVMLTQKGPRALLAGLGTVLIGFAMMLSQSKGALLALLMGLVVMLFACILQVGFRKALRFSAQAIGVLALVGLLAFGLQRSQNVPSSAGSSKNVAAAPGSALSRLSSSSETQTQSVGFRKLLYKGAGKLIRRNPTGYGLGTYRYESARTGDVTQTMYTHNSFLQLGVEASLAAPLALICFALFWCLGMCKKSHSENGVLRAAVLTAVVASGIHNLVDSDLYAFGIGLTLFMLFGVGVQLCADSSTPEYVPQGLRRFVLLIPVAATFLLFYSAMGEFELASARSIMMARGDLQKQIPSLKTWAGAKGDSYWYDAMANGSSEKARMTALKKMAEVEPSTKSYRQLAREQIAQEDLTGALTSLSKALERDPHNFPALWLLKETREAAGDLPGALAAAERLVQTEQTTYYTVRSIPELVPTETARARVFLAQHESDPAKKVALLEGAVKIYHEFLLQTVPMAKQYAGMGADFGGLSLEAAKDTLDRASDAARDLSEVYRSLHRKKEAEAAIEESELFQKAKENLPVN